MMEEEGGQRPHQEMESLSLDEKKFLLAVERGDVASSRRYFRDICFNIPLELYLTFKETLVLVVFQ